MIRVGIAGIGFIYPEWWAKLVCIIGFLLFSSPVSSSVLARSVYKAGIKHWTRPEDQDQANRLPAGSEEKA